MMVKPAHASHAAANLRNPKADEEEVATFTKETLKKHYDKCLVAKQKMHDANADWKSALDAAEKAGIPKDSFKDVIKITTKPASQDRKANVNIMLEMLGKQEEFHFPETHGSIKTTH